MTTMIHTPALLCGKREPELVKEILKRIGKRATNAQVEAWCSRAGRWPKSAEKLHALVTRKPAKPATV
jgi:hypothetical protein